MHYFTDVAYAKEIYIILGVGSYRIEINVPRIDGKI